MRPCVQTNTLWFTSLGNPFLILPPNQIERRSKGWEHGEMSKRVRIRWDLVSHLSYGFGLRTRLSKSCPNKLEGPKAISLPAWGVSHEFTPVDQRGVILRMIQEFWPAAILGLPSAQLSLSGLALASLTRTLVSWLNLPPTPSPTSTHTQLLFPACFIRFDTPHPPAIVRTRKGRMGPFVGIRLVAFLCECGSKLGATSASTIRLL